MNKSYKVVFSKARGALMAVNEATSSVQAKGTKTVVAAAVAALMAGGAMAAQTSLVLGGDDLTVNAGDDVVVTSGGNKQAGKTLTVLGGKVEINSVNLVRENGPGSNFAMKGGSVSVKAGTGNNFYKFSMTGGQLDIIGADGDRSTNGWRGGTNVGGYAYANEGEARTTLVSGSATVVNIDNGMLWGGAQSSLDNIRKNSKLLITDGATINLAGDSQNEAGILYVGTGKTMEIANGAKVNVASEENGAIFANTLNLNGGSITNSGKLWIAFSNGSTQGGNTASVEDSYNNADAKRLTFTVDGGRFETVAGAETNINGAVKVVNAGVLTNAGKLIANAIDISNGGRLSTSAFLTQDGLNEGGATFQVEDLTLNEGGTLELTTLNSYLGEGSAKTAADNNRWLVQYNVTLNGGAIIAPDGQALQNMRVSASKNSLGGSLTVQSGDYALNHLSVGQKGNVSIDGGTLSLVEFINNGTITQKGGKVSVSDSLTFDGSNQGYNLSGGTLTLDGNYTFDKKALKGLAMTGGTLVTKGSNIFEATKTDGQTTYALSDLLKKGTQTSGVIELTDTGFDYSLDDLEAAQKLVDADRNVQLVLNGTLKLEEGEVLTDTKTDGLHLADQTATVEDSSATFNKNTTLGALEFAQADENKAVSVTGDGMLTLEGNGGDVFKLAAGTEKVSVGKLELGTSADSTGTVNVATLSAQNLTVTGAYSAQTVEVSKAADVNGTLSANVLQGKGTFTVGGTGTLVIGEAKAAPEAASLLADAEPVISPQIKTLVQTAGAGAVVTTNESGKALFKTAAAQYGVTYDDEKNVGFYVDHAIAVDSTSGKLVVGDMGTTTVNGGTVALGSNAVAVIDAKAFDDQTAVFDAATVAAQSGAKIVFAGADSVGSVLFAKNVTSMTDKLEIVDANGWLSYAFGDLDSETKTVMLNVTFDETATDDEDINAFAESVLTNNTASKDVVNAIGTHYVDENGKITDAGVEALDDYMALPVVSGTYNAAYDAAEQVWNTISRHNTDRQSQKPMGVWADVFYSSNSADNMYADGYGYESDVYGGVLGFDYTASCGGRLGAAFTIGTSDAESKGTQYKNDADFWGLSVYASKNVGEQLLFSADVSYVALDNDVKGSVAGASADESLDSSVFSVGVRADWTAYASNLFSVVPHVGVRYASIDVDDYREFSSDSMNVVEAPIGVTVKGAFDMSGVKVAPMFDFTAVPQLGDKDVETYLGDKVDVLKETYNTTLGVEAVMGDFSLGLKGVYGFGTNDRENVGVNLNAVYRF